MQFNASAPSQLILVTQLVQAGILVLREGNSISAPGVLFSFTGETSDGWAHSFVVLDEGIIANAQDMLDAFQGEVNRPDSPLRAVAGGVAPEVVEAMPDWAYRKALSSLGIEAEWEAAVGTSKLAWIWWNSSQSNMVTTLEPEWATVVAAMVWAKDMTEEALKVKARVIYTKVKEVTVAKVEKVEKVEK